MMQPSARLGELCVGWCFKHGVQMGHVIRGNRDSLVGGLAKATVSHSTMAYCCCVNGMIVTGNPTCIDRANPSARMGDLFVGQYCGVIITGHPQTLS